MSENKKKKKKSKKKSKKKTLKIVLLSILFIILTCMVILGAVILGMAKTAPSVDVKTVTSLSEPTKFYDDKGNLIDEYLTVERRDPVEYKDIPQNLIDAFVSIEDERFWKHKGIDFKRLAGATLGNVKKLLTGKKGFQGGSTITQQLIKQRYFLTDSLTNRLNIERKIQEMYMSLELEKILSKEKILETYMNTIPLGGTAYGVKSAAKQYFNKDLKDLTLTECAFIASCAQSPSVSYGAAKYAYDKKQIHESPRTQAILTKMFENKYLTQEEYDKAISPQLKYSFNHNTRNKMSYEWFSRPVIEVVMNDLKEKYNYNDNEVNALLANGGLKIYTTMDTKLQNKTQDVLNNNIYSSQKNLQAGTTIMNYHTGEVKVIVGGRGEQEALSYNRAASNRFLRPPGSAIKPLTVYSPAIDTKVLTAASIIQDSNLPHDMQVKYSDNGRLYNPQNADRNHYGNVTLRYGLKHSLNVVAVKTIDALGEDKRGLDISMEYGKKFGLQLDNTDHNMPALALGQLDAGESNGTNPLTLSAAYGAFGNNGKLTAPRLYTKVVDRDDKLLLETKAQSRQVISPQAAYIMYDLLKGPVSAGGTGPSAQFGNMSVRGKTGTTSSNKNLWFSGLTPYYSAAIWVGNDDNTSIHGLGSSTVAKLWGNIMKEAHIGLSDKTIEKPEGIVEKPVSSLTGNLVNDFSSMLKGSLTYKEYFIDGTEPTTIEENIYTTARVVRKSDGRYVLATEYSDPKLVEEKVFIKREYASRIDDSQKHILLPTEYDDAKSNQIPEKKEQDKPNENNKEQNKNNENNPSIKDDNNKNNINNNPNNNKPEKPNNGIEPKPSNPDANINNNI